MKNNLLNNKKRDVTIDLIKGLCIFLMVAGHAQIPCKSFIYLFHMAVFFMASGFVYRDSTSDNLSSVWKGIKKRVKGLWLPFVIANFIFVLLNNYFIKINVYTDNPLIFDYVTGKHMELSSFYSLREQIKYILKGAFFLAMKSC